MDEIKYSFTKFHMLNNELPCSRFLFDVHFDYYHIQHQSTKMLNLFICSMIYSARVIFSKMFYAQIVR